METQTVMAFIIAMFTIGVFLWRVIIYFWNKTKCFNETVETNKKLVASMVTMEQQITEVEKGFEKLKEELKKDLIRERHDGTEVHRQIFERLTSIDKNVAYWTGKKSFDDNMRNDQS